MGWFSSACSVVSSAISSAVSFVGSNIGKIGGGIVGNAIAILSPFKNLELAVKALEVIAVIVTTIAEILGVGHKNERMDELGAKAIQEDTLPREEFKSEQEYIHYLREEIELDREKFNKMSPEERLACTAIGTNILAKSIEEKTGVEIPAEFLLTAEKIKLSAEEIKACIDKFKENGYFNMGTMSDYLQGKDLKGKEPVISSAIIHALQAVNPQMTHADVQHKMVNLVETAQEERR
ncbi:hypothetical protein [Heliophilum fasciatum]|uniref:Uncharacterized protein n=1 Tax=Heliophilum fasciatum TaxID=35700 RepID=A0A4R2RN80_9FIRM|nr:hypothetical protein [Heliophilum fasciatum]MCW2279146.1 hypothetical protein [Heliophilum fasciatum]TCP61231.1 hypothetical protein EDD73_13023 [Heliophilum fasciatum]